MTFREPLGGGPDRPLELPLVIASWKVAPALAAGNTLILKRPGPLTALRARADPWCRPRSRRAL